MTRLLTRQAAFNKNWKVFVVEKKPASLEGFPVQCLYSSDNGDHGCSIGILLNKKERLLVKDVKNTIDIGIKKYETLNKKFGHDIDFYYDLQRCHDASVYNRNPLEQFSEDIEKRLRNLAKIYNLKIPKTKEPKNVTSS